MPLYTIKIEAFKMKKILLTMAIMFSATQVLAIEPPNLPAAVGIQRLKDGNYRFETYQMKHPNQQKLRRDKLVNGQHPFAIILSCSDSSAPPEIIFDQGLGDIYVIRNLGNTLDEKVIENIDYAVHKYGINLVVVLGHEYCNAIGDALKEEIKHPAIANLKTSIQASVTKCTENKTYTYENVIKAHAKDEAINIMENKNISDYIKKHDLKVIPAYYSVRTGKVEFPEK